MHRQDPTPLRRSPAGTLAGLIASMRPRQWVKNGFVFGALIFAHRLQDAEAVVRTLGAFAIFCALSGSVYIINDLVDLERDRAHPKKRLRAIASGRIGTRAAGVFAVILAPAAIVAGYCLSLTFGSVAAAYFGMSLLYSFYLKRVVILDVMTISLGFVLRAVAGAAAIDVLISPWLVLCTSLLALFLGFCKRRNELTMLQGDAAAHRAILSEYSVIFLDQMISVVTASTVIAYAFYAMSPEVQEKLHTRHLGVTVPFVLYGIFRYLYVLYQKGEGGSPSQTLLEDRALLINVILWGITCVAILYYGL